jgi:hypothetical protein
MAKFRTRLTFTTPRPAIAQAERSAVQTVMSGGMATRTRVQFAPVFVLAQDYDDVMRSLRGNLSPGEFEELAFIDLETLSLFARVTAVLHDMVQRGERIAALSMAPEHAQTERAGLAALEARQATEHALVEEALAALAADVAGLRSTLADARADYRAETARQLLDVAPYPQAGSAAAELSVLLASQRLRHRSE